MKQIKHLVSHRFKMFSALSLCMLLGIVLLMVRMKLTHSLFYLFLVWNLFLATIPFAIAIYLSSLPEPNKFMVATWFGAWLLFLPNAPYIVTDLLHLRASNSPFLWLDILVVLSFAHSGLLLFYLSVREMEMVLKRVISQRKTNLLVALVFFLSGFGVYLGRFLRYNSWEIISSPKHLLTDIMDIAVHPLVHKEAWLFSMLFGAFLWVGHWAFKQLHPSPPT